MIHKLMQRLAHEWGMAVICVSHEINQASHFADELLLMRGGKVIAQGPPREVIRREILHQVYDVEIDLIQAPGDDVPLVWAK
jgi:iron complex transport system ATP-binding protein